MAMRAAVVNGDDPPPLSIPSISVTGNDHATTSKPLQVHAPQLQRHERALPEPLIRWLEDLRRDDVTYASSQNEYQRQWREEISEFMVNHPKSKMRILFKRLEKEPYTDLSDPHRPAPSVLQSPWLSMPTSGFRQRLNSRLQRTRSRHTQTPISPSSSANDIGATDDCNAKRVQIMDLFSEHQIWTSWQYECAYPRLTSFLDKANPLVNTRCEVSLKDFLYEEKSKSLDQWETTDERVFERGKGIRLVQSRKQLDHQELWKCVRSRFKLDASKLRWMIPCRVMQIVDLSPTCATLILGSSPRMDLSYIATFLERYLSNTNWASANLITDSREDSMLRNYLLEYHLSFYHVTSSTATNMDSGYGDDRTVRKISPFTAGPKGKGRYIYEEQLSFITIGHGADVYTNIQLAEKYSCDPGDDTYDMPFYIRPECDSSSAQGPRLEDREARPKGIAFFVHQRMPCSAFLAWIANSMRHVVARWQGAIVAVDKEIQSEFRSTFHGDKHSLLSDDSSFSKSKRYIWAIQVYKIFEKKLGETISVWEEFEAKSLHKLDDRQLDNHKDESLEIIHTAIEALKRKRDNIQMKRAEVSDMKDGLFATSQLLDSRVSVRQNDNIRLLTYINLLFLPLAFCTNIFSMQTILPSSVHPSWFAITICAVTAFTAFLVFNLQLMSEVVEAMIGKGTKGLRERMHGHRRPHWIKTGQALQISRDATTIIVQNRLRRTSHWMYFLFIIETAAVTIPIHELKAASTGWGHLKDPSEKQGLKLDLHGNLLFPLPPTLEDERGIIEKAVRMTGHTLFCLFRALFIPLWLLLVGVELVMLLVYLQLPSSAKRRTPIEVLERGFPEPPRKPSVWKMALLKLGFSKESKNELPIGVRRKLRRWHGEYVSQKEEHNRHQRMQTLQHGDSYYMRRSDIDLEAEQRRLKVIEEEQRRLAIPEARRARRNSESGLAPMSMVQALSPDRLRTSSPGRPALARTKSFTPDRLRASSPSRPALAKTKFFTPDFH